MGLTPLREGKVEKSNSEGDMVRRWWKMVVKVSTSGRREVQGPRRDTGKHNLLVWPSAERPGCRDE